MPNGWMVYPRDNENPHVSHPLNQGGAIGTVDQFDSGTEHGTESVFETSIPFPKSQEQHSDTRIRHQSERGYKILDSLPRLKVSNIAERKTGLGREGHLGEDGPQVAQRGGRIAFYGHTHTMRAEVQTGAAVMLTPMNASDAGGRDPEPVRLADGERAWIGTGSVGFPTKKKGAAEFLILNDADWTVEKYTVGFSREQAKARTRAVFGSVCRPETVERIVRWL